MAVHAFTYQAKDNEIEVVKKIMYATFGDNWMTWNAPQYWPDKIVLPGDYVITFGQTLETGLKAFIEDKGIPLSVLHLPVPKKLLPIEGNEPFRDKAWVDMLAFVEKFKQGTLEPTVIKYTDADLPDLDRRHLLMLEKIMEKSGNKYCLQTAKNGKKIVVGDNIPETIEADIRMSFHELYTIRNLMDVLGVKEVQLLNLPEQDKTPQ